MAKEKRPPTRMLGSTARRSLDAAAARHLNPGLLVDGMEESRQIAEQQLKGRVEVAQIQYSFTTLQDEGGGIIQSLSREDRYEYVGSYDDSRLVIAATRATVDLVWTAKLDPPAVYQNMNSFVAAVSVRVMGFCGPLLIWFRNTAIRF